MIRVAPPPAVDLLTCALDRMRPYLDRSLPIGERVLNFWAAAVAARDLGAADQVQADLLDLARDCSLTTDLPFGAETVSHLIRSAFMNFKPL